MIILMLLWCDNMIITGLEISPSTKHTSASWKTRLEQVDIYKQGMEYELSKEQLIIVVISNLGWYSWASPSINISIYWSEL